MQEELGIDVQIERQLWVVENFFEYQGLNCHEIGLYYLMDIAEDSPLHMRGEEFMGDEAELSLIFKWHHLDDLNSQQIYPIFLKQGLQSLPQTVTHVVHIDEKQPDAPQQAGTVG
jgi:hypothetical protein